MSEAERYSTPAELMSSLDDILKSDPGRTEGISAVFAFDVEGANAGQWWIEANNGAGAVHTGSHPDPTLIVYLDDEVLVRLGNHELDGGEAYVSGQLTVEGDHSKAIFLAQIFGD